MAQIMNSGGKCLMGCLKLMLKRLLQSRNTRLADEWDGRWKWK